MKKPLLFASLIAIIAGCSKQEEPIPTDEKCKASDYAQVTIGTQTWLAENYRCSQYDTESEAYKEGRYIVSTSKKQTFTPYYINATDKSKWASGSYNSLSESQIAKHGYLYSWSAAVGVADGQHQTTAFLGNRQGICPNGWHLPSRTEWQTLQYYIENTQGKGANTSGKHLKTTSGWNENGNGLDTYKFAALPVGNANGFSVYLVGMCTYFWTITPNEDTNYDAISCNMYYNEEYLYIGIYSKSSAQSVRCVKN